MEFRIDLIDRPPRLLPLKKIDVNNQKNSSASTNFSPPPSHSTCLNFSNCLPVDPLIMATLAEKLEKIKSPKLQNQHHVSRCSSTLSTPKIAMTD